MKKILVIDFCNYTNYQIGGHLSFLKNLLIAFGNQLALIGITTDEKDPVGKWTVKNINGIDYDFFALARYSVSKTKHIIPDRIMCYLLLRVFRSKIIEKEFANVFVQRPEILPAIKKYNYKNICYRFPGVENPLRISKYWYGEYFVNLFDKLLFSSFRNVNLVLVSADDKAIQGLLTRSKGKILLQSIFKFPTRIDTDIFKPGNKIEARVKLSMPVNSFIISTVGRLTWLKGWKFIIDAFKLFKSNVPDSVLIFIGEGEDHDKIKEYIIINGLAQNVILAGKKVPAEISLYLNASDLFIMGSFMEGWPTSLVEAVACGIPCCVTDFGAATEIINEGENGFVEKERNVEHFEQLMQKASRLEIKEINVSRYSISNLKADILSRWAIS
jgi:glycosyltransferase involved in cell wall biosynthesis